MRRMFFVFNMSIVLLTCYTSMSIALTEYYVDPDYTGGNGASNGTDSRPWTQITTAEWAIADSILASDDVTIYFSAFETDGTTQESQGWFIHFNRADQSTNRLTIDGHAKYNTNDANPSWVNNPTAIGDAYQTGKVFRVTGNGSNAIGWTRSSTFPKQNNITVRGFETTGNSARVSFAGDNTIFEYLYIHDITNTGPGINILYTFPTPCTSINDRLMDPSTNMIIRHVVLDTIFGEAMYLGAVNQNCPDDVEVAMGNEHSGILVENIIIRDPGSGGGQGDGIDCKNGLTQLTIRDCEISGASGTAGIILPQTYEDVDQQVLIERCWIHDSTPSGGARRGIYGLSSTPKFGHRGITIRNTIISNHEQGATFSGANTNLVDIFFYNNTIHGIPANVGLSMQSVDDNAVILNNLIFDNNGTGNEVAISGINITSDYNAYHGNWGYGSEGLNSISMSSTERDNVVTNASGSDFSLKSGSVVIDQGITISSVTDDFIQTSRPQNLVYDIGAYEFLSGDNLPDFPSAPTGLSSSSGGTPAFPGAPTGLSSASGGTPTMPGAPTGLSSSSGGTPTFPGVPTGLSSP